jgi:hypothetical protein
MVEEALALIERLPPPPDDREMNEADGENASRERLEKLFGTVSEITPIGVNPNSRSQAAKNGKRNILSLVRQLGLGASGPVGSVSLNARLDTSSP